MTVSGWLEIGVFVAVLTALTPLIGGYMAGVFEGRITFLGAVERPLYRLLGVDPERDEDWKGYARSVLTFSLVSFVVLFAILQSQGVHPFNPQGMVSPTWDLAFNTSASFVTNTNWQFYGGETTMTYFSQMAGLAVQNFVSAGVGIAVLIAVVRGLAARSGAALGVFFVDLTRVVLYVLLPIAIVGALFLVSQGVIQTLGEYTTFATPAGGEQTLAFGPVASQEIIKQLGTNGGGFFNVNAAMPFENPTGLTNFFLMLMILLIPAGLTATFGRMVGSRRQGWALYVAMTVLFVVAVAVVYAAESSGSTAQHAAGIGGGNLEGKETRFGLGSSALFTAVTTVASCGAVNAAFDSLTALGGLVPMANIATGEVIFGGVGSGLYGMLLFVLLAVFLAGLMVGRTPEYLGKKIEAREVMLVAIGTLAVPIIVLGLTAVVINSPINAPSIYNAGPQGFSETLYAYLSQANNNGSAFAGFTGYYQPNGSNVGAYGITWANGLGALAMLLGRFVPLVAALAVAGSLAGKRVSPPGPGTMRTDSPVFVSLLIATILLVALLTFVPAFMLGPIVQALSGELFLITAVKAIVVFTLLLGLVYPLAVTGVAQVVFPGRADGSLVKRDGKVIGSRLIGQDFSGQPRYFQSRPSATGYAANATFFNNLGPSSRELKRLFAKNARRYAKREGVAVADVPNDAVQTSASGVDPHISEANALIQAGRVARERGLPVDRVRALIAEHTEGGLFGESGVNVLTLNLALDS